MLEDCICSMHRYFAPLRRWPRVSRISRPLASSCDLSAPRGLAKPRGREMAPNNHTTLFLNYLISVFGVRTSVVSTRLRHRHPRRLLLLVHARVRHASPCLRWRLCSASTPRDGAAGRSGRVWSSPAWGSVQPVLGRPPVLPIDCAMRRT